MRAGEDDFATRFSLFMKASKGSGFSGFNPARDEKRPATLYGIGEQFHEAVS